jgi:predicted DNA-binding protein YlxM (UPF0122 family)
MAQNILNDKQIKMIEELVKDELNIVQICKMYDIPRSTYYDWKKTKLFDDALNEALNLKTKIMKQNVKSSAEKYVRWLENIAENGTNENARVNAIKELNSIGGLNEEDSSGNKKDESLIKNFLLDKLKK